MIQSPPPLAEKRAVGVADAQSTLAAACKRREPSPAVRALIAMASELCAYVEGA